MSYDCRRPLPTRGLVRLPGGTGVFKGDCSARLHVREALGDGGTSLLIITGRLFQSTLKQVSTRELALDLYGPPLPATPLRFRLKCHSHLQYASDFIVPCYNGRMGAEAITAYRFGAPGGGDGVGSQIR